MLEWIITIICEIWGTKEKENNGGDGDMESIWMGPVAPTPANLLIANLLISNRQSINPPINLHISHDFK